jgi:hypothetical protein
MCHMIRPWEHPNNLDYLKSIGAVTGHPSKLCEGCDVDDYTMIPSSEQRLVLWQLAEGKSVSDVRLSSFLAWLTQHRPEILPYIKTEVSLGQHTLLLGDGANKLIRRVLAHWGCPDPELKFISPPVFKAVQRIIDAGGKFDSELMQPINLYADGLNSLIEYDGRVHPKLAEEGQLSPQLVSLLKRSLCIAQSSIRDKSKLRSGSVDCTGDPVAVTQPYIRSSHFDTEFEEFVKKGSFLPTTLQCAHSHIFGRTTWLACRRLGERASDVRSEKVLSTYFGCSRRNLEQIATSIRPGRVPSPRGCLPFSAGLVVCASMWS